MIALNNPKRVLFVAYAFPPVGGVGVHRVTKFVKYLPEFGWHPSVLTVSNPSVPLFDVTMNADIPEETIIRRARTLEPGYGLKGKVSASETASGRRTGFLKRGLKSLARQAGNLALQPDSQILWYPNAVREGMRLLREVPHDVIVATAPPFSSFLVGATLARRSGLPLLLDYRDEWDISNTYWENKRQPAFSKHIQTRMQHHVLRAASAVMATSRSSADAVANVAERAGSDAIITHIYNGYDPEDFPSEPAVLDSSRDRFRVVYVGTLWNLNSVGPLVKAVRELAVRSPALVGKLELVFAGRRTAPQDELLDLLNGLPCRVVRLPFVDHSEAISLMRTADALCLLCSDVPHASRIINAKTFEYMAARRPIMTLAPRGELWDLLADDPTSHCCEPSDTGAIADLLATQIQHFIDGTLPKYSANDASRFDRRELAGELADFLDTLTNGAEPSVVTAKEREFSF